MFPVQFGYEADIPAYASTLIKDEVQLLISLEGNFFLTNGDGTYRTLNKEDKIARQAIENLNTAVSNLSNRLDNISLDSSSVNVNIKENNTVMQKSLQEIIDNILIYIPTSNPVECGVAECGMAECGN